jgi:TonB-linked SusC/RagA family outer membrane protein
MKLQLNMLYRLLSCGVVVLLLPLQMIAQDLRLSGTVTNSVGEGLVGATVVVEGAGLAAITDINGVYVIEGKAPARTYRVVFSYIGYTTSYASVTLAAGQRTSLTLDASLNDDGMNLDEVVVTGSTLRAQRRQLGNAVATVNSEQLERSGTNDALTALQGKVAGAQITQNTGDPSGGVSIRLRGVNSLRGDSDPLYVIDGVIVSNSTVNVSQQAAAAAGVGQAALGSNRMADLNPDDIESISVISGAAAAAQYGSRAANGVVLITTKRGQIGKPTLSFSSSVNFNELREKVYISTYGKQFGSNTLRLHTIANNPNATTDFVTVAGRKLATNQVDVTRYDYQDNIFQRGVGTDNNLSVSGGTERTKYFASLGYVQNEGIIKSTDFRRYNLRLNLDQYLTDWVKVSVGANYSNSFSNELPSGNTFFSPINGVNITNNIYNITERDANGNLKAAEPTRINPLSAIETFDITQSVNRGGGSVQFTLTPLEGLTIDWVTGVDAFSQQGRTFIPIYPYDGVNPAYYDKGYAGNATNLAYLLNSDVNVSYQKTFARRVSSITTAGYNYQYNQSDYSQSSGEALSPAIQTINGAATVRSSYFLDRFAISGYYLQQTFGLDNRLFVTLAGRVDGSTKFSADENQQFYPKASASWVLSDYDAWKNIFGKSWSGLKLRGSWGEAGGLNAIGTYDRFWQFSPTPFLGRNTILPGTQYANPTVRPERTTELEFGADLSFLNNRLNLGITWYDQLVTDLVVNRVLASSSGATSIVNNLGEMTNTGIELNLGVDLIKSKNMDWSIYGVYSRNRNVVTKAGSPLVPIASSTGAPAFIVEGEPASVFLGTYQPVNNDGTDLLAPHPDGTSEGLLQVDRGTIAVYTGQEIPAGGYVVGGSLYTPQRDANGQPTGAALRKIIGDPNPDFTGSLGTNFRFSNLNIGVLFDGVYGNDVFNADKRTRQGVGIGDLSEKELKGELPRGWVWAMYPVESWRVDDGSFTKLREVSASWNFGNVVPGVSSLTLGVVGRNLFSWDNYNGYDPETNAGGNSDLLRGIDFGNVPIPRTYQFTLSARF